MRIESAVVSIKCDAAGCEVTQSGHGPNFQEVHNRLRNEGWVLGRVKSNDRGGRNPDLCPIHARNPKRVVLRA